MTQPVAGIVTYRPDIRLLEDLISRIAAEVAIVVIIANSPLENSVIETLQSISSDIKFIFQECHENIGLGAAYLRIVSIARACGAERIVLFDQDSSPHPGMIARLGKILDRLEREGHRPAVLGPRPVSPADVNASYKNPTIHLHSSRKASNRARATWFVISSGSLIPLAAIDAVGSFDADFFIDAIDLEWCMRAWSRGYTCWLADDVVMPHRLGIGAADMAWPRWKFALQPSWRLSLYARNQAALLLRGYIPCSWKLRWVGYLLCQVVAYFVIDRGDLDRSKALLWGFYNGVRGNLGRPTNLPV